MEQSHEKLPKSKTKRKKEAHEVQDLGASLLHLTPQQRDKLPLPPELRVAVDDALRFKSKEAKRRQLQYIGKIMKNIEVNSIIEALAQMKKAELKGWRGHRRDKD